jgi:hypothetical protein
MYRPVKRPVTLRLDADVLAWFQRAGRGYQTRINRALRKVMIEERKKSAGLRVTPPGRYGRRKSRDLTLRGIPPFGFPQAHGTCLVPQTHT